MKGKLTALIILICSVMAMAFYCVAIAYIDAPHNESNAMWCGSCHGYEIFWVGTGSYNALCQSCHTASSCPISETGTGPQALTHLDSDDNELAECRTCHDPHEQKQKLYKNTDADNLYLARGTIIDYIYNPPPPPPPGEPEGPGTSTLQYSVDGITYKDGWNATRLTGKTWECRSAILFPNTNKLGYSYPVIGVDEGAETITVSGDVRPAYEYVSPPSSFAVMYGQYIKDALNNQQVKFFDQTGINSFADGVGIYNGVCEVCHTQPDAPHLAGTRCTNCHTHSEGLKKGPAVGCIGCHFYSFSGRSAVTQQFNANSHHVQGVTLDNTHCYECHWEANADGTINNSYHEGYNTDTESSVSGEKVDLVIYGAAIRPTTYTEGATAIQYMADGSRAEIGKLNDHCLSCHSDQNDTTAPFAGDSRTPKEYAWDNSSIDERYSQTGTTMWDKYAKSSNPKRATNKYRVKTYSAHGNAVNNEGGWNLEVGPYKRHNSVWYEMTNEAKYCWNVEMGGDDSWPDTRNGSENVLCFDCHNSHGSSVSGTVTSYTSATASSGILKDTHAGNGGYTMTYNPTGGGSSDNKNVYSAGAALCFDCHLTETAGDKPWGYNDTFGASEPIMGDRDTPYFGPGISGAQLRYTYKQARAHQGGHFGASSPMTTSVGGSINGLCTPCHDPHGVSTSIIQEYAVPLLKGTWMTSIYQDDRAPETSEMGPRRGGKFIWGAPIGCCVAGRCPGWYLTDAAKEPGYRIDQNTLQPVSDLWWQYGNTARISETDIQFGGLCLQCHRQEDIDPDDNNDSWRSMDRIHETVNGWGANNMHSFPCSKCHTPHSSRLPRLMVTNCLDYNHKGRVYSGGQAFTYDYSYRHTGGMDAGGDGAGKFPAGGSGYGYTDNAFNLWNGDGFPGNYKYGFGRKKCHKDMNSDDWPGRELWNTVTRWEEIVISSGPSAGSFTAVGQHEMATITWETDALWTPGGFASTSCVDYGLTESYGSTICIDELVTDHTVVINMLNNHTTYHYRVRSETPNGIEAVSEDNTFDISVPPTVPEPQDEPDNECAASCSVTLDWNPSTDSDDELIVYRVKVDNNKDFSSPEYDSDWISGNCADSICSWTVPTLLAPDVNTTWWWHVKAQNAEYEVSSVWSLKDSFRVVPVGDTLRSPSIPFPIDEPDNVCDGSCSVTLAWYPSINPTGGFLEYEVLVDNNSNFSSPEYGNGIWTSEETVTIGPITADVDTTWWWKVKAKGVDTGLESDDYSAKDSFRVVPLPNIPPPAPILFAGPDFNSGNMDTDITLRWNPETDPDGHDVQYYVEADTNPAFSNPITLDWTSDLSFDITVAPCTEWWWRVKARDAVDGQESQWSPADNFIDSWDSCYTDIIAESFEKNVNIDGTGYDDGPWIENVGDDCTLDPDSTIPGITPPPDSGFECLQSNSVLISPDTGNGYYAYSKLVYDSEVPKTFTQFYFYVEDEGLEDGDNKFIGALRDTLGNNVITFRLNQNIGQLRFRFSVYNYGAHESYYADISKETWYRVDIKYDATDYNSWKWRLSDVDGTLLHQDNGNLTGTHYTGIQRWFFGFMISSQPQTGTIYFDLINVKVNE